MAIGNSKTEQCLNNKRIRRYWRSVSSSAGCNKYNLALVARNAEKLSELHRILTDTYETDVKFFASALSKTDTPRQLFEGILATSGSTINKIAFQLGFEQLRSFSKLIKSKTRLTPLAFRQSFY